jgi:O-antigen/teichoic acid export membrane protein
MTQRLLGSAVATSVFVSFAVFLIMAVQGVMLARLLGPRARGEYGTMVLYSQALLYIGLLGTQQVLARRAVGAGAALGPLRRTAVRSGTLTGLATMALVGLLATVALPAEERHLALWCVGCALMLPLEHVRLGLLSVDHGSGSFSRYNAGRFLAALCFPLLLVGLWAAGASNLGPIAAATVAAPLAGLVIQTFLLRGAGWEGPAAPPFGTLWIEGLPQGASVVAGSLFSKLDVLLMLWLSNLTVQGLYFAAVPAATLLLVVPNTLALFSFNQGADPQRGLTPSRLIAVAAGVVALQATSALAFAAVLRPAIRIVYGDEFLPALPFAWALLPAHALCGCAVVTEGYLRGRGRPGASTLAFVLGALVTGTSVAVMFGTWRELSIPLGLAIGQGVSALAMLLAIVLDLRTDRAAAPAVGGSPA